MASEQLVIHECHRMTVSFGRLVFLAASKPVRAAIAVVRAAIRHTAADTTLAGRDVLDADALIEIGTR